MELYKKYRPKELTDVIGQDETVQTLTDMIAKGKVPSAIIFQGPSGTGKTTIARGLRRKIGCHKHDFREINAASSRGIDVIRQIEKVAPLSPMAGKARVFLLDEAHHLTTDASTALLKILEDNPPHAYFFLCTTEPNQILPTIRNRCTPFQIIPLSKALLKKLFLRILSQEKAGISDDVMDKLIECADGSPRRGLVLLEKVLCLEDEEARLECLQLPDTKKAAFDLVKALMWEKNNWPKIQGIIKGMEDEDPEQLRRLILACARTEMLKEKANHARAYAIIYAFEGNFFDSGAAGLVRACFDVIRGGK